jgi:uncharacterized protein (DUF1501 family)
VGTGILRPWQPKNGAAAASGTRSRTVIGPPAAAPVAGPPLLVVLELAGGNDGLSMVVPFADPAYRARRKRTAVDLGAVHRLDSNVGLHPELGRVAARGVAAVQGVGSAHPDLSHFEMLRRMWAGSSEPGTDSPRGFLGRLCDVVGDPAAPAVGVSLGWGPTPALAAQQVTTLSLGDAASGFPSPGGDLDPVWRSAMAAMARGGGVASRPMLEVARSGAGRAMAFADAVTAMPPVTPGYPEGTSATMLANAARLLAGDIGVRIVHVPIDGDFDTHTNHTDRYRSLMASFDLAVDAFLADLGHRGLRDRTMVMTTSEFGRRAEDNGSDGLDHGTASSALVMGGNVQSGAHGQSPDLRRLDDDGNVTATVSLGDYYALAARWLGVDPADVLPGRPTPVAGVLGAS